MKRCLLLLMLFLAAGTKNYAQFTRYIIQLKNKYGTPYTFNNPAQYLSQRAIDRRTKYSIALDSTDLPITPAYIDSIQAAGVVTILNVSKWLNQVCISTTDAAALTKINSFPFVIGTAPVAARPIITTRANTPSVTNRPVINIVHLSAQARPTGTQNYYNYGLTTQQIAVNNGIFLHNHGFAGNGLILAMIDDGFYNYQSINTFDSVRNNNQLLGTWDFVLGDTDVNSDADNLHGTECLSLIASNWPAVSVGAAPQLSFYLYRTEDVNSESPVEEQNWAAAAERADSVGADVISSSLGYSTFDSAQFNHTYSQLNGHTTIAARAANFAAAKGILVVVSAGNSGTAPWHYILTPGDADSALTVGAVDSFGISVGFSSYGPNSSGQTKPDIASDGYSVWVANPYNGGPTQSSGTSCACPITAGLSSCLWQAFPEVNNMNIVSILHRSGNRANNPDNRTGYGVEDMKKAFVLLIQQLHSFQSNISGTTITLNWTAKSASDMNFVVERKLTTDAGYLPIDTASANTNFQANNFSFTDNLAASEAYSGVLYRIKMNIAADTSFYLDSVAVPSSDGKIVAGPNPVSDNLTITITRSTTTAIGIDLYNTNGQKIYSQMNLQAAGTATYSLPFKPLANGVYFAVIYFDNKKVATKKIVRD